MTLFDLVVTYINTNSIGHEFQTSDVIKFLEDKKFITYNHDYIKGYTMYSRNTLYTYLRVLKSSGYIENYLNNKGRIRKRILKHLEKGKGYLELYNKYKENLHS